MRQNLFCVDLGNGQPIEIGYGDEKNHRAVRRFLEPLAQQLGVSVTEDYPILRSVIDKLDVAHQVCRSHLRRWVSRCLHQLRN